MGGERCDDDCSSCIASELCAILIFFILNTEWRWSKCIRGSLSWHCWRDIQKSLVIVLPVNLIIILSYYHRETWFTQDHVNQLALAGINTVRIPVCWFANFMLLSQLDLWPLCFSWDTGSLKIWWIGTRNSTPEEECCTLWASNHLTIVKTDHF